MAKPDGLGGWELDDDDVSEVMAASGFSTPEPPTDARPAVKPPPDHSAEAPRRRSLWAYPRLMADKDTGTNAGDDERGVTLTVEGRREARRKLDEAAAAAAAAGDSAGRRLLDKLHAAA